MFEKLLSVLPFNPGSVQQLSFYAKRMRQEESIRRVGLVFIVFAFLIQFFAFVSPPQSTLAESPNDLINGGFSGPNAAAEAASDCRSNIQDYGTILSYYGITCDQVANAGTLTINSDAFHKDLWSMGRLPYNLPGESTVSIPSLNYSLYVRYLWGWDKTGSSSNYQMLNVTTAGGQTFLLMYACGNLVSVGPPQPVQKTPKLIISKTTIPGYPVANSEVSPGGTVGFRVLFSNTGGPANDVFINDTTPANTTESTLGIGNADTDQYKDNTATWYLTAMPAGASDYHVDAFYKVAPNTPNGTRICNIANIRSAETPATNSNSVCVIVHVNAPPPKKPPQPCEQLQSSQNESACITIKKTASNLTTNVSNANGTTAQAGNVIKYTLYATNIGSSPVKKYVFQDSLAYVLDYSKVIKAGGGKVEANEEMVWTGQNIDANKTVSESFEVKVDNPIPQTPTSTSDPKYFNLTMSNTYGNTITINLPGNTVQTVQEVSSSLPNTGPGDSIIIGAVVTAVAGYFFFRSRLLAKESKLAISEQSGGI